MRWQKPWSFFRIPLTSPVGMPFGGSWGTESFSETPMTMYAPPMLSMSLANAQMAWTMRSGLKPSLNSMRVDSTTPPLTSSSTLMGMAMVRPLRYLLRLDNSMILSSNIRQTVHREIAAGRTRVFLKAQDERRWEDVERLRCEGQVAQARTEIALLWPSNYVVFDNPRHILCEVTPLHKMWFSFRWPR